MAIGNDEGSFISGEYTESAKEIINLIKGWKFFNEMEVVVGITEESNAGRDNGDTNASILYKNEQGEPAKNIPPRPVLKPAIAQADVSFMIAEMMKSAMESAIKQGDTTTAEKYMEKAGMVGRDACKNYIASGTNLAPNAPSTIARKGSSKPLIDTGSMLGSISYAVRRKK